MPLGPILNLAYLIAAAATAPWWMRKARGGWGERFGRIQPILKPAPTATSRDREGAVFEPPNTPERFLTVAARSGNQQHPKRLLIHAVSVGEVNLIRPLIDALLERPDEVQPIISVTTDTGIARARALYADRCPVVRYPLDATWAVRRFLDAVRPDAVALTELELWPNFASACERRGIPISVINGRLSARSFKRYRIARPLLRRFFAQLAFVAAQDEDYAQRFVAMGTDPLRCVVAGSMKWDAAPRLPDPALDAAAEQLAADFGIDPMRPLIVAGSTAPGEHELILRALWSVDPSAQLLCAPRRPEWFDDAAKMLPGCVRRTTTQSYTETSRDREGAVFERPSTPDRSLTVAARSEMPSHEPTTNRAPNAGLFLLDTIGELRAAYQLATIVVIGRSFINLHGSDPMEPAALAKPIIIGPQTADFEQAVNALLAADGIVQTIDEQLPGAFRELLPNPARRAELATNAANCVEQHRGATQRHLDLLLGMLRNQHSATPTPDPSGSSPAPSPSGGGQGRGST